MCDSGIVALNGNENGSVGSGGMGGINAISTKGAR